MPVEPLTLSLAEAAQRLGISKSQAYSLARRDVDPLPTTTKLGTHLRVPVKALERWIEEQAA